MRSSRIGFLLATVAIVFAATSLNGCPQLLALLPTPTPSPSGTPDKQATLPGGNAYQIQEAAARPGCNGER